MLSQPESAPLSLVEQAALLLAVEETPLDPLPLDVVSALQGKLAASLAKDLPAVADRINQSGEMNETDRAALLAHVKLLIASLTTPQPQQDHHDGAARPA